MICLYTIFHSVWSFSIRYFTQYDPSSSFTQYDLSLYNIPFSVILLHMIFHSVWSIFILHPLWSSSIQYSTQYDLSPYDTSLSKIHFQTALHSVQFHLHTINYIIQYAPSSYNISFPVWSFTIQHTTQFDPSPFNILLSTLNFHTHYFTRWSRGKRAGLWYPSSRVQTRPSEGK